MIPLFPSPIMILLWCVVPMLLQTIIAANTDRKGLIGLLPAASLLLTVYAAAAILLWFVPFPDLFRMTGYSLFDAPAAVYGVFVFGLALIGGLIGTVVGYWLKRLGE